MGTAGKSTLLTMLDWAGKSICPQSVTMSLGPRPKSVLGEMGVLGVLAPDQSWATRCAPSMRANHTQRSPALGDAV
jgi:hypothetical protein